MTRASEICFTLPLCSAKVTVFSTSKERVALFVQRRAGKDEPLGFDDLLINASPYVIQSKITDWEAFPVA